MEWVVFDLGGVLLAPTRALPELAARIGAAPEVFVTAYYAHRRDYDRHSDAEAYWSSVAESCGVALPLDGTVAELTALDDAGWSTVDPDALRVVEGLRPATRLAVLSNAPASMGELVRGKDWSAVFEHILISGEIGTIKPEPGIYATLLGTLGSQAGRVVFVDDRADNVAAAEACGIRGIHFTGTAALQASLADLGLPAER